METELKIIKNSRNQHLCFGCWKPIKAGNVCWCLKTIDNGEDFRWFHGEQCYNEFEFRIVIREEKNGRTVNDV